MSKAVVIKSGSVRVKIFTSRSGRYTRHEIRWTDHHGRRRRLKRSKLSVARAEAQRIADDLAKGSHRSELSLSEQRSEAPTPPSDSPPITAAAFESGCNDAINGWLWDETYSLRYSEPVSLGIAEMRHIANVLRAAEGLPLGVVQEWSDDAVKK